MRRSSGWVRMVGLFAIAGLCEVCAYGQVTAFTPLHLPDLGVASGDVAFWVGAVTASSTVAGPPVVDRLGFGALVAADAVVMGIVVALLAFGYRDGFVPSAAGGSLLAMARDGILLIVRSPRLRALFPAYFVFFSGWMLAYIYVPLVVARLYTGADPATAVGIVFGAGGLATLVASPLIGALADRVGHWRTLFVGGAALVVLWLGPYFARDFVTFAAAWA